MAKKMTAQEKSMTSEVATTVQTPAELLERVVVGGDLSKLSAAERMTYYRAVCASVGLNPLTKPFEYIYLNGKLTLYAKRDATDQLRSIHGVSITKLEREVTEGIYVVTAYASSKDGRTDTAVGAVPIENVRGEARANAYMKAETKSKRRVTLSICGLGLLDETEIETIPDAVVPTTLPAGGDDDPADDRESLLAEVKVLADKMGMRAGARAQLWREKCGDGGPDNVDLAALVDLRDELRKLAS